MDMDYELFNIHNPLEYNKYYPLLKSWWEGKGGKWQAINPNLLSSLGIIIREQNKYICASWLYTTNSPFGIINWVITNNSSKAKIKKRCIEFMLSRLEANARIRGVEIIYMVMGTESLKKILNSEGYMSVSNNISEFIKKL